MNDEERMDEISGVHARAMLKVSQSLTKDETSSFKSFLVNLKPDYTRRIEPTKDFQEISGVLISGGNIKPGKYTFLKDLFDRFGRSNLVDVLSEAEQEVQEIAKQKENNSKILLHHADLTVELKRTITPSQLETLILFFREMYSGGEMDEINSFNDMWKVLMRQGDISPGRYGILERALRSIQATSHLQILNDFNEKIKSEDGRYERWIRQDIVVNTVEELMEKKEDDFRRILEKGGPGVMFKNATISNIGAEGGELPLTNGSAKLKVPQEAVDRKLLFWMFVGQDCGRQFAVKSANEPLTYSDGIVKYSIPVRLGPSDFQFKIPVVLNTKQFSEPPSANGSPGLGVYSRLDGNSEWELVGSCLYDPDSNNNLIARVSLNHFSSYVLGMPVSSDLLPLNVRVMVQTRPVKADVGYAGNELHVFFTVNDYSFSQELVLHNWINVDSATCLYLDPTHDVSVSWVKRHSVQKSVRCIKKEILHKEHIQNLPETPVFLKVAAIDGSDSADIIETESEFEDILILEQNGTVLVELPFTESASAVTTSSEHPTDCPKEKNRVTDLSKRLIFATLSGNKNEVQRLLNEGANIETRDKDRNTLMSLAHNRGYTGIVQLLLEGNASVETVNSDGWYIIHSACKDGHGNIVKQLLDRGVNLESQTPTGATAIYIASQNGHELVVKLLLDRGADIGNQAFLRKSPLFAASQNGHENVVNLLLDRGADIDSKTSSHKSPLCVASQNGHENVVKLLLDRGADIEIKTSLGESPLYAASQNGHENVVKLLLDRGAHIDSKAFWDKSPLYAASQNGHENVVKLLLDRGAYIEIKTSLGESPLYAASQNGHENVVKLLLDRGADIDSKTSLGGSPLYAASQNGHKNVVKLLVDRGADIGSKTRFGEFSICVASQKGHGNVVHMMLNRSAGIESVRAPSVGHGMDLTGLSREAVDDSWSRRLSTDSRLSDASSVESNTSCRSLG